LQIAERDNLHRARRESPLREPRLPQTVASCR
jgi:hypothetical protein